MYTVLQFHPYEGWSGCYGTEKLKSKEQYLEFVNKKTDGTFIIVKVEEYIDRGSNKRLTQDELLKTKGGWL